jgi:transcriptional antiterminator RfaH
MNLKWRAVFCKPREEQRARMHLVNQGYEAFLPQVRSRRRLRGRDRLSIEPMFPRYLFIALADHRQDWGPIRSTRGVIGLVRFGTEVPVVPDDLIATLKRYQDEQGAFAGYRGIFEAETGEARAIILLEILNHQRRVQIATGDLRRA